MDGDLRTHRTIVGLRGVCCFCNRREFGSPVGLHDRFRLAGSECEYEYKEVAEAGYRFRIMSEFSIGICRRCASRLKDGWAFFIQVEAAQAQLHSHRTLTTFGEKMQSQLITTKEIKKEKSEAEENFKMKHEYSFPENFSEDADQDYDSKPAKISSTVKKDELDGVKRSQVFRSEVLLQNYLTSHDDTQIKCPICGRAHSELAGLRRHWKKDHRADAFHMCNACPETFPTSIDAMRHQENVHEDRTIPRFKGHEVIIEENGSKILRKMCGVCGETVSENSLLFQHAQSKHVQKYICHICAKEFRTGSNLRTHVQTHTDMKLTCEICSQVYKNPFILKVHKRSHETDERLPYICPKCPDAPRFKYLRQRQTHLVDFHNEAPKVFGCKLCPKVFKSSSGLCGHMKSFHLKQYKYKCSECDFQAVRRCQLAKHTIKHAGVKDYKCEVCRKGFTWKNNLVQHMKIHNNIRNFACDHCDMAFVQKISLLRHMKIHL